MPSKATQGQVPDVYGQVHPVETPDLIQSSLAQLQVELEQQLDASSTTCWKEAQEKCRDHHPSLIDQDFQLKFLRCEVFNADLAAKRLTKYWKKRVEIFGPTMAFQPLTLENLSEDDQSALSRGVMTLLPQQDPSGRSIVYWDPSQLDASQYQVESMIRAFWYVLHAALEPVTAQQHGIVVIVDPQRCSWNQVADTSLSKLVSGAMSGVLPLRLSGIHIVYPPYFVNLVLPAIQFFMPERMQQRIQFHSGDKEAVIAKLEETYGLTPSTLPTLMGGTLELDHAKWLESRRQEGK